MLFCDKKYWKLIQHAVTNAVASLDHLDYLGAGRHLRTVRGGFHIYECYLQVGAQDFTERCGMEYKSWRICREPQNGPCSPKTEIYEWMRICQIINKPIQMTIIDHLFASSLVPWPMAHMSHHGHENHTHDQITWSDGTFPRLWSGGRPQAVV